MLGRVGVVKGGGITTGKQSDEVTGSNVAQHSEVPQFTVTCSVLCEELEENTG